MSVINHGYETSNYLGCTNIRNIRVYIYHFHQSIINTSSNEYISKIEAAPITYLTIFSLNNNIYKEEKNSVTNTRACR